MNISSSSCIIFFIHEYFLSFSTFFEFGNNFKKDYNLNLSKFEPFFPFSLSVRGKREQTNHTVNEANRWAQPMAPHSDAEWCMCDHVLLYHFSRANEDYVKLSEFLMNQRYTFATVDTSDDSEVL